MLRTWRDVELLLINILGFFLEDLDLLTFKYCIRFLIHFVLPFIAANFGWIEKKCSSSFVQVSVSYHAALKKMLQVPRFYNNHFVCFILNALTFENLVNFRTVRFYMWMESCSSPCFRMHKSYFLKYSYFKRSIDFVGATKCGVSEILGNDIDSLLSRITFVQAREPSSFYFGY